MKKTLFIVSIVGVAFFISAITLLTTSFRSVYSVGIWVIMSFLLVMSAFLVSKSNRWLVALCAIILFLLYIFLNYVGF